MNRESAYEVLQKKVAEQQPASAPAATPAATEEKGAVHEWLWGTKRRQGLVETIAKQAARTAGSQLGRQILRGVLGGITGRSR